MQHALPAAAHHPLVSARTANTGPQVSTSAARTMAITKNTPLEEIPTPDAVAPLFQHIQMGAFKLETRAAYAPLTRCRSPGAITQPDAALYYSQRANAGQLLITEATGVGPSSVGYGYPNTPGLHTAEQTEAWKPIVAAVHAKGAIIFTQLWHTGRASGPAYHNGEQAVAPSAIAIKDGELMDPKTFATEPYPVPRALETEEVQQYVEYFRTAARNAEAAGMDGVEVHCTNGYLINQFLDDASNKRTDIWGGTREKRCRFCLEVVKAVVDELGADRVGVRLGPFAGFLDSGDSDPYGLYTYLVEELKAFELAYIHFIEPRVKGNTDREEVNDTIEPFTKLLKGTKTVVITAGGFIDHSGKTNDGPKTITDGAADMVAYGRWALANPDMLKRFKLQAPLNRYDRDTFYVPGPKGYTDYPFLEETEHGSKYYEIEAEV